MNLKDLEEKIKAIEVTYDYEEVYSNLYNACIDYMNDTQSWEFEYLFDEIIDYELAEERAKWELENGGLLRLYYFLGDANLNRDLFRIDGYGNLTNVNIEDLDELKEEILDKIKELEGEN